MAALTAAQLSWRFCVVGGIKSRCVLLVSKANQLIERKCIAKKRVEIGFRIYVEIKKLISIRTRFSNKTVPFQC